MSYLNRQQLDLGADSQDDAKISIEVLARRAEQLQQKIDVLPESESTQKLLLQHQLATIQIDMDKGQQAWTNAMPVFQLHIKNEDWEQAVVVCDTLFRCNHTDSLVALGHALWLSITFPVDLSLTIAQLQHVINETPEDSDGAAVAAAVAAYVSELRGNKNASDDVTLAVGQMLNEVARRHGNVQNQQEFDQWFKKLELDQPPKLLVRMRNIIDVLVQDQWWFDRAALQALIPSED